MSELSLELNLLILSLTYDWSFCEGYITQSFFSKAPTYLWNKLDWQEKNLNSYIKQKKILERLNFAVAGGGTGLWDWNIRKNRAHFTSRVEEILGIPVGSLGEDFENFKNHICKADRTEFEQNLENHLQEKALLDCECRLVRKDGALYWVRVRGLAIWDDEQKPVRVSGSIADINERKKAQLKFESQRAKAERAVMAKSEFLANMSHEIRTPMNGLIGMIDLLDRTKLDDTQRSYVDVLQRSGETLLGLINDVLDFSKIESGQMNLKEEAFDLGGVIQRASEIMAVPAAKKSINLTISVSDAVPQYLIGDALRLRQVLLNLVSNAIKFTPERGEVFVKADAQRIENDEYSILLSVKDTGVGISEIDQEKIFHSFTQVESAQTDILNGTGLGLSITSHIVEMMGGELALDSEVGSGSQFSILVKLRECCESREKFARLSRLASEDRVNKQIQRHEEVRMSKNQTPRKILLVDDNPDNRLLIISYLKDKNYKVEIADDGTTALDQFFKQSFDLVLMDVKMKIMNGHEATQRIRQWEIENEKTRTPVLALTAYAMKKDVESAKAAGCDGHLSKPIRREELLEELEKVFSQNPLSVAGEEKDCENVVSIDHEVVSQLGDLIPDFLKNREADVEKIKDALSINEYEIVETVGHNMAGTAPGYGFSDLGKIGEFLEDAAIDKNREDIEKGLMQLVDALEQINKQLAA